MKLSKCKECNQQFDWGKVYKSLWFIKPQRRIIQCKKCGTKHDLSPLSRYISFFLCIPILILGIISKNLFLDNIFVGVILMLMFSLLLSLLLPYLVNHEKINLNYMKKP